MKVVRMAIMVKKLVRVAALLGPALVLCGCNFPYLVHCGMGEARVLSGTVPMTAAMNDPKVSAENHDKLLWVRQVRAYAQDVIGLKTGKSYLCFYDTKGGPAVYNLSACRKDSFHPHSWWFPVVGKSECIGYFNRAPADTCARQLQAKGYDTAIYGAGAYSTAGWLADPLFSSLLQLDKPELADTVIHELTHNTVFKSGDDDFLESVANFVGKKGALDFLAARDGKDSPLSRQAIQDYEDRDLLNVFFNGVYRDLDAYYRRTDLSSAQKIAGREQIFLAHRQEFRTRYLPRFHHPEAMKAWGELPANNAYILLHRRYNRDTAVFERVFQACHQNLRQTVTVFVQAAKSPNAWRYLQNWTPSDQASASPQPK